MKSTPPGRTHAKKSRAVRRKRYQPPKAFYIVPVTTQELARRRASVRADMSSGGDCPSNCLFQGTLTINDITYCVCLCDGKLCAFEC